MKTRGEYAGNALVWLLIFLAVLILYIAIGWQPAAGQDFNLRQAAEHAAPYALRVFLIVVLLILCTVGLFYTGRKPK